MGRDLESVPRRQEFVELFSGNAGRVYGYIAALLPNWTDADDVFQETSKVLWEKFDEFQSGTDFFAWACRVSYYQVLAFRRRQQRSKLRFSDELVWVISEQADRDADRLQAQSRALAECITRLKDRDRELIHLRYRPEATTKSVAAQVGRSVEAVYKALNRIEHALLECVRRRLRAAESVP